MISFRSICAGCLLLSGLKTGRTFGQSAEPPLPEWNEHSTPIGEDSLAPPPGSIPEPVELPPIEEIPDLPPLLPPTDGEQVPEMPEVPGLAKPKIPMAPNPDDKSPGAEGHGANDVVASPIHWHKNPREARQESLRTGKPMLFVFGGFGWSPACQALNNDLFTSQKFNDYARGRLVLTFFDVPSRSSGMDSVKEERLKLINQFRKHLKVRSLPTMILFDGEGREIDRLVGYNFNRNLRPAALTKAIERIARVTNECNKRTAERESRRQMLAKAQDYRWWNSTAGSRLFARVIDGITLPAPTEKNPDATEPGVALLDETGKTVRVFMRQLKIEDREIARRDVAKRNPAPPPPSAPESLPPLQNAAAVKLDVPGS